MTQPSQPELSPIGASFAERLGAFHRSLPPEEQKLLEEILALADRGMAADDTSGYALNAYLRLANIVGESSTTDFNSESATSSFSLGNLLR